MPPETTECTKNNAPYASFTISLVLCSLLLLVVSAPAQSPSDKPLPRAPGAKVTNLTPAPGFFNEPSIAVNPRNPRELVAAYQVKATVAYSRDGGQSWRKAEDTAANDYRISGDVSVAFGADGAAYLCYIAFDRLGTAYY